MSRRKKIKNVNKDNSKNDVLEKDNYFKFITTLAVLLIVFVLSYFIMGLFYTKEINFDKSDEETQEEVYVDNNTIMLGQLLDQSNDDYYVLIYDVNDKNTIIPTWKSVYESKENPLTVYVVDSKKKFNAKYIVEKGSNSNATKLDELKVVSPTLIRITNKKISEYVEGEDNIVSKFKN